MDIKTLFALQILVYASIPFFLATLKPSIRAVGFYFYVSLVLLIGSLAGSLYSLPLTETINISGGNISYGALMYSVVLLVILERDFEVLRNIIKIVVVVNVFIILLYLIVEWAFLNQLIHLPFFVDAAFDSSLKIMVVGGILVIVELVLMILLFEQFKKKTDDIFLLSFLYTISFVSILYLDGIFFPLFRFGFDPALDAIISSNVQGKLILGLSYSLPILVFLWVFRKKLVEYADIPLTVADLWGLPRKRLVEEISLQRDALKESEKKYRELVELAQEGIWVIDKDSKTTFVNPSMEKMLGYGEGEMLGRPIFSFMDERGKEIATQRIKNRKKDIAEQHDSEFVRKDGKRITVTMQTGEIVDENGDYAGSIAGMLDITERKRMEEELRESQIFNQTLLDTSPDLIYVYDIVEEKNIYSNQGIKRILGYSIEEIQEKDFKLIRTLMHPEDYVLYQKEIFPLYQQARDGEVIEHEYRMQHKDGVWHWLLSKETILTRQDDGTPEQILGLTADMTESKRAEETFRAEAQRNKQILAAMLDGFILADTEGQILRVNPAYSALVGYSEAELLQMNIREVEIKIPPEEVDRRIKQMVDLGSDRFETQHQHKDGHALDLDVSISIMQNGGTPLVAAFVRDITKNKKAAKALQQSEMRFRRYFEQGLFGMTITSGEKAWIEVNDALCEMFGYSREELLGLTWADITYPEDLEPNLLLFNRMVSGEIDGYSLDKRFLRKDGSILYTELSTSAIRKGDGLVDYLITLINDVTERKLAEEALRASHERMLTLLNSVPADIYVSDLKNYKIIFMNEHMQKSFGDDIVGEICYEAFRNESEQCSICPYNDLLDEKGKPTGKIIWEGQNPISKKWYVNYDRAVPWTDERLVHVQIAVDISERKEAENALLKLNEELDKRVEERTEELHTMVELMTGREVRMAELKKVITRLRKQLKEEGITPSAYDPLLGPDQEW